MTVAAVRVRRMRFWGRHGVTEEERSSPQEIELDVEMIVDAGRAIKSDRLDDAVDYVAVYEACERVVTQRTFTLLESVAGACLEEILHDRRIERATIRVRKPQRLDGATPEVEMTRSRSAS